MPKVYNADLVSQAIAKQTLNGGVVVFYDTPRKGLTQETVPVTQIEHVQSVNAIQVCNHMAIRRGGSMLEVLAIDGGFLKVSGWVQDGKNPKVIQVTTDVVVIGTYGTPPSEKNPAPTLTHWAKAVVLHAGVEYAVLFETRGVPVTTENVQQFMPQGLFFTQVEDLNEYYTSRLLFLSDVSSVKPVCIAESYSHLGKAA